MARPLTSPHRYPPEVVEQALQLADTGWTAPQIARILAGRGINVHKSTVHRWMDPKRMERDRVRNRESQRRKREEARRSRPPDPYAGMTGLSKKIAMLEDRVAALEGLPRLRRVA